jgi:hypothetical protein
MATSSSVLDYHLTDMKHQELQVLTGTTMTDHKLVSIKVFPEKSAGKVEIIDQDRLAKHLGPEAAVEVMLNPNWPELPFIKVAKIMKMCKKQRTHPDQAHTLMQDFKKVKKILDDPTLD